jgi:hypothetical protein
MDWVDLKMLTRVHACLLLLWPAILLYM